MESVGKYCSLTSQAKYRAAVSIPKTHCDELGAGKSIGGSGGFRGAAMRLSPGADPSEEETGRRAAHDCGSRGQGSGRTGAPPDFRPQLSL